MVFAPHQLYLERPASFPLKGGGRLEIEPGGFVPYRFSFESLPGDEIDTIGSIVELVDSDGSIYRAGSCLSIRDIVGQMGAAASFEPPVFLTEDQAENLFSGEQTFFRRARELLDDRFERQIAIEGQVWKLFFQYQTPRVSLRFESDEEMGHVELKGLVEGLIGEAEKLPGPETALPPIQFPVDLGRHLFAEFFEKAEDGSLEETMIGRPVTFERIEEPGRAANRRVRVFPETDRPR